jgi:hypothetical protein
MPISYNRRKLHFRELYTEHSEHHCTFLWSKLKQRVKYGCLKHNNTGLNTSI